MVRTFQTAIYNTGRITKGKGQIDAIKACEILLDNNIDFIFYIVGGYENNQEKDRFLDVYNQLPYKDKIKLVGFTKDVNSYLQMADIYLFPSYGEGFGNSFVEALYSKAVCISYENTTFIEFKNLGFDFEMVENKNIEKLKNSLFKVAKKELNFDVNKNRKIVEDIFSKSSEINRYLEILV